jgi:hypothetical protein
MAASGKQTAKANTTDVGRQLDGLLFDPMQGRGDTPSSERELVPERISVALSVQQWRFFCRKMWHF